MKKKITGIIAITFFATILVFNLQLNSENGLSDVTLENIEALAGGGDEDDDDGCDTKVHGSWLEMGTDSDGCTITYQCEGEFCYPSGEAQWVNCFLLYWTC